MEALNKPASAVPVKAAGSSPAVARARVFVGWSTRALLGRKKALAIGFVVTAVFAILLSSWVAKLQWECAGMLLYSPLTNAESQSSMYSPPEIKTLVSLAKEPAALHSIAKEFQLDIPLDAMAAMFVVTSGTGTKTIEFKLKWGDPKVGAAMLSRLMELFRSTVLDIRLQKIDDYAKGFESHQKKAMERYTNALKNLQEFNKKVASVDISRELSTLNDEYLAIQVEASRVKRIEANYVKQAADMDKFISDMRRKEMREGEENKEFEAADETIADNRRRQDRIRELIQKERTKIETEAQLVAKRAEYRRSADLYSRGAVSKEEVEVLQAEIGVLVAKIKENTKIVEWEKELERIDQVVVPKGKKKNVGSPIVQQALTKRLEIELIITGNKEEIQYLQRELANKRERIDLLFSQQLRFQALAKDVEAADQERQAASNGLNDMRKLQSMRVQELVMVTPATPAAYPTSNRKLWIIGFMMGGLLLTLGSLLGHEYMTAEGPSCLAIISGLGLPILERFTGLDRDPQVRIADESSESLPLRLFALRLRQSIRTPSAVCLFSSLNEVGSAAWLVIPLARCLARRDERVLIIDAAGHPEDVRLFDKLLGPPDDLDDRAGLSGYLGFLKSDPEEVALPTRLPAIDCLPHGDMRIEVDSLATHRMTELVDALRERYTMILLIAPPADRQVDLELLAARSDAVVFVADDRAGRCLKYPRGVRSLAELGAPILGAVVGLEPTIPTPPKTGPRRIPRIKLPRLDKSRA